MEVTPVNSNGWRARFVVDRLARRRRPALAVPWRARQGGAKLISR
jgi:hypothetical protein